MDASGKDVKSTPTYKFKEKLLASFCILSVVGICLVIALFVRVETVHREAKTMESKLLEEIQQLKDTLKAVKPRTTASEGFGRCRVFGLYFKNVRGKNESI